MNCPTPGCPNERRSAEFRWCDTCTGIVLRTGRPPELLPTARVPLWLERARQKPHGLARPLDHAA